MLFGKKTQRLLVSRLFSVSHETIRMMVISQPIYLPHIKVIKLVSLFKSNKVSFRYIQI